MNCPHSTTSLALIVLFAIGGALAADSITVLDLLEFNVTTFRKALNTFPKLNEFTVRQQVNYVMNVDRNIGVGRSRDLCRQISFNLMNVTEEQDEQLVCVINYEEIYGYKNSTILVLLEEIVKETADTDKDKKDKKKKKDDEKKPATKKMNIAIFSTN